MAVKKPAKKTSAKTTRKKRHTLAERIEAIFRCKCGESHETVAKDIGITTLTMGQWVNRYKPIKGEVLLEMLNHNMARMLRTGELTTRELSASVSAIKMIVEKGTDGDNENRLEELQEAGAKQLVYLKGLAEKAGVEIDT